MPIISALYSLLPGKTIPKYSCVLSVLIPFKEVYVVLLLFVPVSLGFLCLQDDCCNK